MRLRKNQKGVTFDYKGKVGSENFWIKCHILLRAATNLTVGYMIGNHRAFQALLRLSPSGIISTSKGLLFSSLPKGAIHVPSMDYDENQNKKDTLGLIRKHKFDVHTAVMRPENKSRSLYSWDKIVVHSAKEHSMEFARDAAAKSVEQTEHFP